MLKIHTEKCENNIFDNDKKEDFLAQKKKEIKKKWNLIKDRFRLF